ncbi:MAG: flagellar motor switch protein FliN [Planctomycetota bacterium]
MMSEPDLPTAGQPSPGMADETAPPALRDTPAERSTPPSLADGLGTAQPPVHQVRFAPLQEGKTSGSGTNLDLLLDVTVTVTAEMGSRSLPLEKVLELKPGSVVELDRSADEPIDLLVNGKPIARGEVVVIEDQFGVRITEILSFDAPNPKKKEPART